MFVLYIIISLLLLLLLLLMIYYIHNIYVYIFDKDDIIYSTCQQTASRTARFPRRKLFASENEELVEEWIKLCLTPPRRG